MRTMLRGKVTLLFLTCAVLLAIPAVAAVADQIQDDIVSSTPARTITVGGSTTVNYFIQANGSDGCNVDATHSATVKINAPSGVTATPSTLSFTKCKVGSTENSQSVTYSSDTASSASGYPISVSASGGIAGNDGYNTGNASFTLFVTAPPTPSDTTAPTLHLPANITQEATGATGNLVTFTATADDTNPAHPTVDCTPASGSTFVIGTTTVNCSATDAALNTANGSFTVTVRDTT